jgi:hypothetical protein
MVVVYATLSGDVGIVKRQAVVKISEVVTPFATSRKSKKNQGVFC